MTNHPFLATLYIAAASLLLGYTLFVSGLYWVRWRRRIPHPMSLLPLHVWTVAVSYDLLLVDTILQAAVRIRWWHHLLWLPSLAFGFLAMSVVHRLGGRKERLMDGP